MREIKGHKSWSVAELTEILKRTGKFTACGLPHYRYSPVRQCLGMMQKQGLVEFMGGSGINLHYRATPQLLEGKIQESQQQGK